MMKASDLIIVGKIVGLYGVRGWVKLESYTDPRTNILKYTPWQVHLQQVWQEMTPAEGRAQGKSVVARLAPYHDRDQARELLGAQIAIRREQLPALKPGTYYWADLVGLRVINRQGIELGQIDHLFETGANDVLVVVQGSQERLIPYVWGAVVEQVDLEQGLMRVDWDAEF